MITNHMTPVSMALIAQRGSGAQSAQVHNDGGSEIRLPQKHCTGYGFSVMGRSLLWHRAYDEAMVPERTALSSPAWAEFPNPYRKTSAAIGLVKESA